MTAVEYVIEQLRKLAHNPKTHLGMGDIRVTQGYLDDLEQIGKQMEKVMNEYSWIAGAEYSISVLKDKTLKESKESFEKYYNETYNKE